MIFKGNKIIGSAGVAALVCFFLPWVTISCQDQMVASLSGWNLAAGGMVETALGPQVIDGTPLLFLVLLGALGCLMVVYRTRQGWLAMRKAAFMALGFAGVSLLILFAKFFGAQGQISREAEMDVQIHLQYGLWGTLLSNGAIIAGAVHALIPRTVAALPAMTPTAQASTSLEADVTLTSCSGCGTLNAAGYRYCMACGTELPIIYAPIPASREA